eukprot:552824-Rhodomonas_salina.3
MELVRWSALKSLYEQELKQHPAFEVHQTPAPRNVCMCKRVFFWGGGYGLQPPEIRAYARTTQRTQKHTHTHIRTHTHALTWLRRAGGAV